MIYEEDIMIAEPYTAKYKNPVVTGIVPEDCIPVGEAFRQVREHIAHLYNGSLY